MLIVPYGIAPEDTSYEFPPVEDALDEPNGLLAMGGDLSPQRLMSAYKAGIFPWSNPEEPILWWSPNPRCVFNPNETKPSKSMRRFIRNTSLTLTHNQAFEAVIDACRSPRDYCDETWINKELRASFIELHNRGFAHSFEAWDQDKLVGGLYGLRIGRVFCGESMFSRQSNASKLAFFHLVDWCNKQAIDLIDGQVENEHLMSLGAQLMDREKFLKYL